MKYFLWILIVLLLASQAGAIFFPYEKSQGWLVADIIFVVLNTLAIFIVANNDEDPPPTWKIYMPILLIMVLIILVLLPQAQSFSK